MGYFYDDLEIGKRGEALVMNALIKRGHIVEDLTNDSRARWNDIDFRLTNKEQQRTTLEVKNDIKSESTGNVFIETYNIKNECHSFKGWYFYCSADFICFVQEHIGTAHIVLLEELKQTIKRGKYREVNTSETKGILVPIDDLRAMTSYVSISV